jgi:hypothetical protein
VVAGGEEFDTRGAAADLRGAFVQGVQQAGVQTLLEEDVGR